MKKWIYRILLAVCIGVFAYSAYNLWQIYSTKQAVEKEVEVLSQNVVTESKTLEPDWAALQAQSPDIVAWLYIPGCNVSYPVVQGDNNSFYLNHTISGEYNEMGAFFLDYAASPGFTDDNSIIYGHSVEGGGMCTDLRNYLDQNFFNTHQTFYLLTPEQNYECQVAFFAATLDGSAFYTTSFGDFREQTMADMMAQTTYAGNVDLSEGRFVTISTCDLDYGFNSDHRFVLTGKLQPMLGPVNIVD